MGADGVVDVAQELGDSDAKGHAANHHDEGEELNRDVHGHDLVLEVGVSQIGDLVDGEADGDCA